MSSLKVMMALCAVVLMSFFMGCAAPDGATSKNMADGKPVTGGIAVGISPRVIYADRGENVTFSVDLMSTENADDRVTISISGTWFNENLMQDVKAGSNASVPMHITVPLNASNMSFKVKAQSHNLNATSTSAGMIFIEVRSD